LDTNNNDWFYLQETEVSIWQWKRFLSSTRGADYLEKLRTQYQDKIALLEDEKSERDYWAKFARLGISPQNKLPGDSFVRFLILAAARMKDKMPSAGEANTTTPLEVSKWEDTKPMVYLSAGDAQEYCDWLVGSAKDAHIRLPTADEWRRAARDDDLKRAVEGGAMLRNLIWVQREEGPHNVILPEGTGWFTRGGFVSMFGNVAELVRENGKVSAIGASYRTAVREPDEAISYLKFDARSRSFHFQWLSTGNCYENAATVTLT
jgi:formylglycine-generating enzyme required for sulfatase activity